MLCPAVYPPDPTLGITDPQMLPPPKLVLRSRNYEHRPCPECGKSCPRDRVRTPTLHDLGDPLGGRPREIRLTYSQHHCTRCRHYFTADMSDLAAPKARYTHRVVALAVRLVVGGRLTLSDRQLAPLARPSGLRPLRHHPELGGGQGEKRRPIESGQTTSIGPSTASPGTSPTTSCTTAPSASCRSSITVPSSGCATRSLTIPRLTGISGRSSSGSRWPWPAVG